MPYTRYGEINKGEKPYNEYPVFNFYEGHFQVREGDWVWNEGGHALPSPLSNQAPPCLFAHSHLAPSRSR